jgi:hypothetical protein
LCSQAINHTPSAYIELERWNKIVLRKGNPPITNHDYVEKGDSVS